MNVILTFTPKTRFGFEKKPTSLKSRRGPKSSMMMTSSPAHPILLTLQTLITAGYID